MEGNEVSRSSKETHQDSLLYKGMEKLRDMTDGVTAYVYMQFIDAQ